MSSQLSPGAFVIRNKKTRTALHLVNPAPAPGDRASISDVVALEQDENQYHSQQIWWVEPLADAKTLVGSLGDPIYSITNPCSGKALHMEGDSGQDNPEGIKINASIQHGVPSTWWRIRKADGEDGPYYHLVSVYNGQILDVVDGSSGALCHSQHDVPGYDQQCWEFVTPVVGFPPGWFHIENAATGHLLSQTYLHHAPVLLASPPSVPSQCIQSWQFQWAAYHPTFWHPHLSVAKNSWVIVNRLTRGVLLNKIWEIEGISLGSVTACQPVGGHEGLWQDAIWKLELDSSCNWKIINHVTSFHLEETQVCSGEGMQAACIDSKYTKKGGNKSWLLRPPMLKADDESPPEYVPREEGQRFL